MYATPRRSHGSDGKGEDPMFKDLVEYLKAVEPIFQRIPNLGYFSCVTALAFVALAAIISTFGNGCDVMLQPRTHELEIGPNYRDVAR
ncbi:hypothetical protein K437DRAFT_259311 [Tilletiaria anomala UBC 951]|uniref:Uncharacterized protein n=1 Tax=Tilletiaria anomala (strain ATCC 24038 / CBS 436.72 / UBC 951) TaxID=1037660 RepID=A0A066VJ00_TILAU|nr:uncharacterized protein K437DRAFT_259311 [Tilletiaria anomala UBC 951]KDN38704.1 hypothetical protein K437DRAFT_259311 [Tilletiaria anomala UBC 951]